MSVKTSWAWAIKEILDTLKERLKNREQTRKATKALKAITQIYIHLKIKIFKCH